MKAKPGRIVLAFYSAEERPPEKIRKALDRIASVCVIRPDSDKTAPSCRPYARLRLEGEFMVAAQTPASAVETAVNILQSAGSPAIFVIRPNFALSPDFKENSIQEPASAHLTRHTILSRLRKYKSALEGARHDLVLATRLDHALSPAAEWILDNTYLIHTQFNEVQRHLPRDYSEWASSGHGHGDINAVAHEFLSRSDYCLTEAGIRQGLKDAQSKAPFTIAELWAFPLFLRIALIEELTELATRVNRGQQLREAAYLWANRLAGSSRAGTEAFNKTLQYLETEPISRQPDFVTALAEQLQDEELALGPAQRWIEQRFGKSLMEVVRSQHTREANETISTSNAFGSLRILARLDFKSVFEDVSLVEAELRKDPAGTYPLSDFLTRDRCRRVVEKVSRYSGLEEFEVARRAINLAGESSNPRSAHVAWYLLSRGLAQLESETHARIPAGTRILRAAGRYPTPVYLTAIFGLTACFTVLSWLLGGESGVHPFGILLALTALSIFPLSELAIQIVNALVISLLPAEPLPKMDFRGGIPAAASTLVVVPMMLSSPEVIRAELEKLEVRFLGNRNENVFYSLFSDFTDSPEPSLPQDAELLQIARDGIADLNKRYPPGGPQAASVATGATQSGEGPAGDRFLLFHRPRVWSESEQRWIGRERKRGKLEDLNAYLCADDAAASGSGILDSGHLPRKIAYVLTLDADTQLPADAARRLIETIAHPLNKVEIDPATRVRKSGYTIIQPRVSITLPGAMATRFTRIFADSMGTDPYSRTVSDAQQDLFLEAIFHGKAIYDVGAFHEILGDRFPSETLLSHDLIEGAHVGVALASDIQLFEHLPVDYGSFAARQHRWIRGDWQIARWTMARVPSASAAHVPNPLSEINRWRVLDNLRRSLVPVTALLLLLLSWITRTAPGVWSLVVGLAVAIPAITPLFDRLALRIKGAVHRWQGAADELVRTLVLISFLPHQAWLAVDAIVRVFYRRSFSHRNLLEWNTADHVRADVQRHRNTTLHQLMTISALSILLAIGLIIQREFLSTAFFVILWAASPLVTRWMGQPGRSLAKKQLNAAETLFLRSAARETWRFFDDLVGPESNWLPPDNTQLALRVEVAQRTSPTNIGLWLTSTLAARDFGYLTPDEFCRRCSRTMETLSRLERYEGHLLNWYDTRTLEPLNPRYVSTVDSGNLIAALWVLQQGCHDILRAPLIGQTGLRGLNDTLSILEDKCGDDPSATVALQALRRLVRGSKEGYEIIGRYRMALAPLQKLRESQRWHVSVTDERLYWAGRFGVELTAWINVADRYLGWMETLASPPDSSLFAVGQDAVKLRRRALHQMPSLAALAESPATLVDSILAWKGRREIGPELSAWLDQLGAEYAAARANAAETIALTRKLTANAAALADSMNMRFLYDGQRKLFGVGYAVGGPREFHSHYDLLASECRLTSLVAIAKGDLPAEHWFALNRPYAYTSTGQILLSWSGTMFEYLMPLLFTRTFNNSLLDHACRHAVQNQIAYGGQNGIPWGISESAWSALDSHQIYQYRAFGVPSLALNPSTENERVVSPYSSVLALQVDPGAASDNLERLKRLGMAGPMGFYEAIDFSRENRKNGTRGVLIYCYMAHHQGMSLTALDNVLHRDIMQRRFHGDLRIRAVESLLFEGVPLTRLPIAEAETRQAPVHVAATEDLADRVWTEETAAPRVHLQGNGRYTLMITNSGGGYSRWNDFDITRWRSDSTLDPWGSFVYIRDLKSDEIWATSHKPLSAQQGETTVRFASDRAEIHRRVAGIETILDVTVAPEDDVELRRIKITNRSLRTRQLEFTSYVELAMASHGADKAHPAFAKMFVETECPAPGVLLAHRRPRAPGETPIWTAHVLVYAGTIPDGGAGKSGRADAFQFETDRAKFLGRGNSLENPAGLRARLSGSSGTVIDPIFSLRCRAALEPRECSEIAFLTMAAPDRNSLLQLVAKYSTPGFVSRAFEMAWTRAQLEFRFLRIGPGAAHRFQELASQLVYPTARLRPPIDRLFRNRLGQENLWAYGISGDLPMLTVTLADSRNMALVREVLLAHAYWRLRGFRADLIILNQESPGYEAPLRAELMRQIQAHASDAGTDKPGGVFLRDWHAIPEEHRTLILAASSIVLSANRGSLQQQLAAGVESLPLPKFVPSGDGPEEPSRSLPFLELPYFNGLGGFSPDGREYAIYLKPGTTTPAPWVNVIANANFGTMTGESGLGFTWAVNSQANRLTPWHNDPVSDTQSEVIYMRDDENGAIWTPTALPCREKDAYRARHGQGYTVYEHNSHAIGQELTVFVPVTGDGAGDPVKVCRLRLRNDSSLKRRLTVTWFGEWVLGSCREDQSIHIQTSRDEESGALLARQYWNGASCGHWAFAACWPKASSWTCDRGQFLGRDGSRSSPAGLERVRLDNRTGMGADPCAAQQVTVTLERGQQTDVVFLLGQTETIEQVRAIVQRLESPGDVERTLASTRDWWDQALGALQVKTPVLSTDLLLNRWLLYQTLSCRFWGRSALYQSGGAFGFRDQLQDSMALVYALPQLTRAHILTAAARQFPEGDVQHWWHPETGVGVRTLCSDDLLWLPFVVTQYIKVTNDTLILEEKVPFIEGPLLSAGEHERMFTPSISTTSASLEEHCKRAIGHAFKLGSHNLPLMGNGDWNDGMNLVGAEGRGESVWLAWFLAAVLDGFAQLLEDRAIRGPSGAESEAALVSNWRRQAEELRAAVERAGWDGEWYLRAYFDNGSPLGSHTNSEARIDSLPQSWAVIAGGEPARARRGMDSAANNLVRENDRLVLLFTPPFERSDPSPGYIMGYPAGLRENGGQYTHGAIWMAMAWARLREGQKAVRLLQLMSPVESSREPAQMARYKGEPYVVAADVYNAPGRIGECGWTWYTGSAAWMYRVWLEEVLGFRLRGDHFTLEPSVPPDWPGFELRFRHGSSTYEVIVNRHEDSETTFELDGVPCISGLVPVDSGGGTHRVVVSLAATPPARQPVMEPDRKTARSLLPLEPPVRV
jgi:cyclic beta-1,2-glucan synthetase